MLSIIMVPYDYKPNESGIKGREEVEREGGKEEGKCDVLITIY